MSRITTVIFDMDGTTLNTLEDLTASMNYVMDKFGFPSHTPDEYRRVFGNGIRFALEKTVPAGTSSDVIDEMIPVFKNHYDIHCLDNTKPYDGIITLMKRLKELGFKMAIVSNKIDSAVRELNDRFFSEVIDVAIGERQGIRRKPAPDTVKEAMKELHSPPEESVYVGDSEVDLQTAINAGLPCISVLWGFRERKFLSDIGATVFAESPQEVLDILQSDLFTG